MLPAPTHRQPPYCDENGMRLLAEKDKRIADLELALGMIAGFNSPDPEATAEDEVKTLIQIARNALSY